MDKDKEYQKELTYFYGQSPKTKQAIAFRAFQIRNGIEAMATTSLRHAFIVATQEHRKGNSGK